MNLLFSLILLLAPIRPESGHFTIYQDGKKIGTEEFSIALRKGGYIVQGRTVIGDAFQKVDLTSTMELNEALLPTSYVFRSPASSIRFKTGSPSSELETTVKGEKQSDDVAFPSDGVIIDSNFFYHYAILLYRVAAAASTNVSDTMTIPAFVPQQLGLGPITVKSLPNSTYEMDSGNVRITATTDKDGRLIRLTVPSAKVVVERS